MTSTKDWIFPSLGMSDKQVSKVREFVIESIKIGKGCTNEDLSVRFTD